jgi:hypothetical protein
LVFSLVTNLLPGLIILLCLPAGKLALSEAAIRADRRRAASEGVTGQFHGAAPELRAAQSPFLVPDTAHTQRR